MVMVMESCHFFLVSISKHDNYGVRRQFKIPTDKENNYAVSYPM